MMQSSAAKVSLPISKTMFFCKVMLKLKTTVLGVFLTLCSIISAKMNTQIPHLNRIVNSTELLNIIFKTASYDLK